MLPKTRLYRSEMVLEVDNIRVRRTFRNTQEIIQISKILVTHFYILNYLSQLTTGGCWFIIPSISTNNILRLDCEAADKYHSEYDATL